eukprot:gb/GECG01010417.1/.p1 GENE.gb/GECG01010417.1/~~gb/GECG01010417.1/.p1  ORF type:complete len:467 (+),score=85.35 gb/GECG01010417.1/:1-1401(+)
METQVHISPPRTPLTGARQPLGVIDSNNKTPQSISKKGEINRSAAPSRVTNEESRTDADTVHATPANTGKARESNSSTEYFTPDSGGSQFFSDQKNTAHHVATDGNSEQQEAVPGTPASDWSQSTSPPLAFTRGNDRETFSRSQQLSNEHFAQGPVTKDASAAEATGSIENQEYQNVTCAEPFVGTCTKNLLQAVENSGNDHIGGESPSSKGQQSIENGPSSAELEEKSSDDEVYQTPAPRRRKLLTRSRKYLDNKHSQRKQESSEEDNQCSEEEIDRGASCINISTIKKTIKSSKYRSSQRDENTADEDISDFIVSDKECDEENEFPVADDDLPGAFDQLSIRSSEETESSEEEGNDLASPVEGRPTIEKGRAAFVDEISSDEEDAITVGKRVQHGGQNTGELLPLLDSLGYNWSALQDRFPQRQAKKQRDKLVHPLYSLFNKNVFNEQLPASSQTVVQWSGRLR